MRWIDLRPYGGGIYTEIIECSNKEILFQTYKKKDEKYYYSIMVYNIDRNTSVEIYSYEVMEETIYLQYPHVHNESILIIKTHNPKQLEVDKIDRKDGKNKRTYHISTKEDISSIPIFINEQYIIFYTDIDLEGEEYKKYVDKGFKDNKSAIYLYDLEEEKAYFIRDFRIIEGMGVEHGRMQKLPLFLHKNGEYLIFNETYMDDWEYEDFYDYALENKIDQADFFMEALYYIKLNDFVTAIKAGEEDLALKTIKKKALDGWVRYLYQDSSYIYYRDKDFSSQLERIIKINKLNLKSEIVAELDYSKIKGRIFYDDFNENLRIYSEETIETKDSIVIELEGLYNCNYNIKLPLKKFTQGYRVSYTYFQSIGYKFIIVSGWYEEESDDYYDLQYIKDLESGEEWEFVGNSRVCGDILIVYESTLL